MKKRVISIFLCVAMTASMLIGCGSSSDKKEDKSETSTESKGNDLETDTVRLALAGSAHIFNAIAEEQGYLEDKGLTVEYVNCENSEGAFQSLAAGKVDVLSNYGTNLPLQYIGSGTDLTMFAGYMITGCMPIIAKKGTTWNGVEDMVGKTVACEPNVFAVSGAGKVQNHIKTPSQWSISCWMISAVQPVKVLLRVWNSSFCHCTLMLR